MNRTIICLLSILTTLGLAAPMAHAELYDFMADVKFSKGATFGSTVTIGSTALSATAAEINKLAGVTAGTVTASKALVVGATKNLDTLVIADSGLYLGSGAGTAVTATAAELNKCAGVTAGTVTASKALVVGSTKNLDTLLIAANGFKIGGAGAGVATFTYENTASNSTTTVPYAAATQYACVLKSAQTTAGELKRADLTAETASYPIDLQSQVKTDAGLALDATGGAGLLKITNGTHAAPALKLQGETATSNTKTDYACQVFVLPPEYVSGGAVTVKISVDLESTGTKGTNTIDVNAYELDDAGAVGTDICETAAQDLGDSPVERQFVITPTGLAAGDKLLIYYTMVVQESAGGTLNGAILDITIDASIKG